MKPAPIGRYDGIQLYNYKSNSGALLGNSKGTYVESAGLVSTVRTWGTYLQL